MLDEMSIIKYGLSSINNIDLTKSFEIYDIHTNNHIINLFLIKIYFAAGFLNLYDEIQAQYTLAKICQASVVKAIKILVKFFAPNNPLI